MAHGGTPSRPDDDRLGALHGLRGLSAMGVATVFHFQHFGGDEAAYPFAQHLPFRWLYGHGFLLVDLFFVLSGVILTYRYLSPVAEGEITGRQFFLLRFSRLYPLHLVTLLFCAGVEWTLLWLHRAPVIYEQAGLYDFALQALYLHSAFNVGWAFNAPSWSVGAEILAYCSFFLIAARYRKHYVAIAVAVLWVALWIENSPPNVGGLLLINPNLARGLTGFYLGSLGYLGLRRLEAAGHTALLGRVSALALTLITILGFRFGYDAWIGEDPAGNMLAVFLPLVLASVGFPALNRLLRIRPLVVLGDLSYTIYLVHVPIQMVVLAVTQAFDVPLPTDKPAFWLAYAATVVGVAALVRHGLERPCSRWLRQRYGGLAPSEGRVAQVPPPEQMPSPPVVPAAVP
jgi:peptidoglycan/LPS O-acetylase OafA/YrhL